MDLSRLREIVKGLEVEKGVVVSWNPFFSERFSVSHSCPACTHSHKIFSVSMEQRSLEGKNHAVMKRIVVFLAFLDALGLPYEPPQTTEPSRSVLSWYLEKPLFIVALKLLVQDLETFRKLVRTAESQEMFLQLAGVELD